MYSNDTVKNALCTGHWLVGKGGSCTAGALLKHLEAATVPPPNTSGWLQTHPQHHSRMGAPAQTHPLMLMKGIRGRCVPFWFNGEKTIRLTVESFIKKKKKGASFGSCKSPVSNHCWNALGNKKKQTLVVLHEITFYLIVIIILS